MALDRPCPKTRQGEPDTGAEDPIFIALLYLCNGNMSGVGGYYGLASSTSTVMVLISISGRGG
jgi:hypothetical protein